MIRRDSGLRLPVLASLLTLTLTTQAYALPVGTEEELHQATATAQSLAPSWEELDAAAVDFTAIVGLSNCSGSLVRFKNSRTTDYAMVLTNGHCTGSFIPAGEARVNVASSRTFSLLSSSGSSNLGTLRASKLIYGTMTGTDMALYLLTSTYAQISSRYRVAPLLIADSHPVAGTSIRVVSGFWRKIYSCTISKFVPQLTEGSWTWQDSIRYSEPGCEVIGGTSGSPIISASSYEVVGVNNTTNESGARCTVDNPCEIDSMGNVTVEKGASYGQQLYQIYTCVNASNAIDLSLPGCKLQKPATP